MAEDLVSGLLAAIEQREQLAKAIDEDGRDLPESWHTRQCGYAQGEWLEDCDCEVPQAVLRLCRAHRNIIEQYESAERRPADLMADRTHGTYVLAAERVADALRGAVRALAEGYGIEEENSDGQ